MTRPANQKHIGHLVNYSQFSTPWRQVRLALLEHGLSHPRVGDVMENADNFYGMAGRVDEPFGPRMDRANLAVVGTGDL